MPKQLDFMGLHRNEETEEVEAFDDYLEENLEKRYKNRKKY